MAMRVSSGGEEERRTSQEAWVRGQGDDLTYNGDAEAGVTWLQFFPSSQVVITWGSLNHDHHQSGFSHNIRGKESKGYTIPPSTFGE